MDRFKPSMGSISRSYIYNLPLELILEILKQVDSTDMIPLLVSSRLFYSIWSDNYKTICRCILEREASAAKKEALDLLEAQTGVCGYDTRHQAALLLRNCIKAQHTLSLFEQNIRTQYRKPKMKPIECDRFLRALYRVWKFRKIGSRNTSYIDLFGALELKRMKDILRWYSEDIMWPLPPGGGVQWCPYLRRVNAALTNTGSSIKKWPRRKRPFDCIDGLWSFFDEWWENWEDMPSNTKEPCGLIYAEGVSDWYSHEHASLCVVCNKVYHSGSFRLQYVPSEYDMKMRMPILADNGEELARVNYFPLESHLELVPVNTFLWDDIFNLSRPSRV
ncbi:hypothetical protein FPQ18DRAFT_399989 [Pyronema domesticum]|nr:hypothetical protein FPQ18DRAFT_399989 [Pyronema domesticum]